MTFNIQNIKDLISLWPDDSQIIWSAREVKMPCPFCPPDGERDVSEKNGITFVGDDRFVIQHERSTCFCRRCAAAGRGRGNRGWYFLTDVAEKLKAQISIDFKTTDAPRKNEPLTLLSETDLIMSHAMVNRQFWYDIGWDDETINHFRLGLYEMYATDGPVNIIPMEVRTVEDGSERKWFVEGRADKVRKEFIPTKRLPGSSSPYFWFIHGDLDSETVVLVEGAKDAISAYVMGFKNVICTFGTTVWTAQKTRFLADKGFKKFLIFGDNDDAGQLLTQKAFVWAGRVQLDAYTINWQPDRKKGCDVSDILLEFGKINGREYIETYLIKPEITEHTELTRPTFIRDYREHDPYYEPKMPDIITLEEIRGEGELSMGHSIDTFPRNVSATPSPGQRNFTTS